MSNSIKTIIRLDKFVILSSLLEVKYGSISTSIVLYMCKNRIK